VKKVFYRTGNIVINKKYIKFNLTHPKQKIYSQRIELQCCLLTVYPTSFWEDLLYSMSMAKNGKAKEK
jgi:hypothetical protein